MIKSPIYWDTRLIDLTITEESIGQLREVFQDYLREALNHYPERCFADYASTSHNWSDELGTERV
jgi:hypothetical protein